MSRLHWSALAMVMAGILGVTLARAIVSGGDDPTVESERLAGAELVAGVHGDVRHRTYRGDRLADLNLGGTGDDDLRAYDVRTGGDGTLYLLTGAAACDVIEDCFGFVVRIDGDMVVDLAVPYSDVAPGQVAVAPDSQVTRIGPISRLLDFTPPHEREDALELPFQPLSGSYTPEGTLVVSRTAGPEIVAIRPDGTAEHLLAPTGSPEPAPARFDSDTASLTVVALTEGRIAFATNAPDDPDLDGRVYLLDEDTLRPLDLPDDTHPIRRIFPGPDGTLLALEGPHITQVDPDTATTNRLIDLSEVTDELAPASDAWPPIQDISATAHGDDLLFTANYQLWRLPDAFE